ncbi:hypothetical protein BDZ89DRAFT_1204237 [Hymenopellis radicata]|nr:hypothetical protein BDZ89DRAFT_1204237 [Hymenopellis radicata]
MLITSAPPPSAVVVWRALALWGMKCKAAALPILSLMANLAMNLYHTGCMARTGWHERDGLEPLKCLQAQKIAYFLSLGINALATLMIAARAWQLRRSLAGTGVKRRKTDSTQQIPLLFYLIYWAAKLFAFFPGSTSGEASFFAQQVLFSLANVIVVNRPRTAWDNVEESLPGPMGLTEKNMVFAKRHQQFPSLATTTTQGGSVSDEGPDEGRACTSEVEDQGELGRGRRWRKNQNERLPRSWNPRVVCTVEANEVARNGNTLKIAGGKNNSEKDTTQYTSGENVQPHIVP